MFNGIIWMMTISYPFLVWFSLDYLQPRYLALALAGLFLLRVLLYRHPGLPTGRAWSLIIAACPLFLLVIAFINETRWLLAYPIFVSLVFFAVFAFSVIYPPTIVERIARLEDPDLPPKGVIYTRKVTLVWCGFFLVNATISLLTIWHGDPWLWSLYNGGIIYVLMGLLMVAEMAVRRKVKASY
jgi:uncharacterized membrane protein